MRLLWWGRGEGELENLCMYANKEHCDFDAGGKSEETIDFRVRNIRTSIDKRVTDNTI